MNTRAVARWVVSGNGRFVTCDHCGKEIKHGGAGRRKKQVICNVYEKRRWVRTEQYHEACYDELGRPYGDPDMSQLTARPPGQRLTRPKGS